MNEVCRTDQWQRDNSRFGLLGRNRIRTTRTSDQERKEQEMEQEIEQRPGLRTGHGGDACTLRAAIRMNDTRERISLLLPCIIDAADRTYGMLLAIDFAGIC